MNELLCKDIINHHIGHAYLFFGPAEQIAREAEEFIAGILCLNPQNGNSCGKCSHCLQYRQKTYPDLVQLSPEGKQYKVKQFEEIYHLFGLAGSKTNPLIFCFEKADRMDEIFADRMLKALEEPANNVVFLLLAENEDSVRQTIKSRCRIMRFSEAETENDVFVAEVGKVLQTVRCGSLETAFKTAENYEKKSADAENFFAVAGRILGSNYAYRSGGETPVYSLPEADWSLDLLLSAWQWAISAPVLLSANVTLRLIVENFLLWIKRNGGSHGNCSWCAF